jgi:cytochrome P450
MGGLMSIPTARLPPGPAEPYDPSEDLLVWMGRQSERFGGTYRATAFGVPIYVISEPKHVARVLLENWANYPKGRAIKRIALLLGNGLMVSQGEVWRRQRRMIQPAFQRKSVDALAALIQAENRTLLAAWESAARAGAAVNVTRDVSVLILRIVLKSIFGADYERIGADFEILSDSSARDLEFAQTFTRLRQLILGVVDSRRLEGRTGPDFLGSLMDARDRDSGAAMPEAQLAREAMTLIIAGHETTASALNWTWYLIARHAEVRDRLARELAGVDPDSFPAVGDLPRFAYTRSVLEEALRLYPPGWLMTRKALAADTLGEFDVPAGTEIYVSPYFIQRRPDFWPSPERFDPGRFGPSDSAGRDPLHTLPFSVGPRNCIGEHLARLEMQIHLMMVAGRLALTDAAIREAAFSAEVNLLSRTEFVMRPSLITETPG